MPRLALCMRCRVHLRPGRPPSRPESSPTARGSKPSGFPTVAFFAGDPHPSVSAKMSLSTSGAGLERDGSLTWPSGQGTCWPCTLRRPGCKNGSLVMNVSRRIPVVVSKRQTRGSCRQPGDVASGMLRTHHIMQFGQRIREMGGSQKLGSGLVGPLPAVSFCLVSVLDLGGAAVKCLEIWELAEVR